MMVLRLSCIFYFLRAPKFCLFMRGLLSTDDILSGDFQSSSVIFGIILDDKNSSVIVKVFCVILLMPLEGF